MKKLFTLLFVLCTAFALKSSAQNGDCSASFTFTVTNNFSVSFIPAITKDTSANHQYWSFGDGTSTSTISPVHVYASAGTYTVKHYFYRTSTSGTAPSCIDSSIKQISLTAPVISCNLHAAFSFHRDSVQTNNIKFTNLSTPSNSIVVTKWTFGDGSYSYDFNTSHAYSTSGLYTVCLTILNNTNTATGCMRDTCINIQVQVPPPPPPSLCNINPDFTWRTDSTNSSKIFFTNTSTPINANTSVIWFFGDSTSSTTISPDHIYAHPGTYNVCVRVSLSNTCYKYMCKTVEIKQPTVLCNIQPNFTWRADTINTKKLYFTNTTILSSAAVKILWSFGDGTSSTLPNPDHTYAQAGTYNVCETVYASSICVKEICKSVEVRLPEINCQDISKFSFTRSTVNCLEFKFIPVNLNANWQYHWSFGDGTGSNDMSPSHVYNQSGNYTVFLTVYRTSSCVSTAYIRVETGTCFSCNNIWVKFEYAKSASISSTIAFHGESNYPILTQTWTINKLSISGSVPIILNANNPVYTFTEPGDYNVCLRAVTQGQCVKEYCEVINIPSSVACTLSAYPNPAHSTVAFAVPLTEPEMIHIYIYNSLNVLVKQKDQQGSTGNNAVTLNIEDLINGWYTVKIVYGNRICYSRFQKI